MRPTHANVDLIALRNNIIELRSRLEPACKFMAVVKADAYGHGILETARAAADAGAQYLGVAIPEEGMALRQAGILAPMLVMGGILPHSAPIVVENELIQTVYSKEICEALEQSAESMGKSCKVHIKVDTGMGRIGVRSNEEMDQILHFIVKRPFIEVEGMFTHFAVSEIPDKSFTELQYSRFTQYVETAKQVLGYTPLLHCSNSGAILDLPAMQMDMVRGGLTMYGYPPAQSCASWGRLKPVLSWETHIVQVKEIEMGETLSYGRTYTAPGRRLIATLPVGYGDGYKRGMSGKAQVLIHGQRVPVVGTICMDQCMADVTALCDVAVGDEVVLLGAQGKEYIGADEMAAWADTVNYEILLSLSPRVPRIFR